MLTGDADRWRTAPSVLATGGTSLAGQSFGSPTVTGMLRGAPPTGTVPPGPDGGYAVTVPADSALLLTR